MNNLFVVRLWDSFDYCWMDISGLVSREEAERQWGELTKQGTEYTSLEDGSYYSIFPANTSMIFSRGGFLDHAWQEEEME